jgi:hypothetical protein
MSFVQAWPYAIWIGMIQNQDGSLLVVGNICDDYPIHSMFAKLPICLEGEPGTVAVSMRESTRQLGRYLSQEFCHGVSAFRRQEVVKDGRIHR